MLYKNYSKSYEMDEFILKNSIVNFRYSQTSKNPKEMLTILAKIHMYICFLNLHC